MPLIRAPKVSTRLFLLIILGLSACTTTKPPKPTFADSLKAPSSHQQHNSAQAKNQATPTPIDADQIAYAERLGNALYQAMLSADATDPYTSREADLINMTAGMRCEGNYKAVSVYDNIGNTENLYLILENSNPKYFQIGRHIRFRLKLGTNQLIDVTPSSKTCMAVPSGDNSIPYVTHIMSNEPTEFHVFLSLYHHKAIYVGTKAGAWKVENGKIELLESK